MALALLKNKANGKLIGADRSRADELLKQFVTREVKDAIWEEIKPSDPQFEDFCAKADGKPADDESEHSSHWPKPEAK